MAWNFLGIVGFGAWAYRVGGFRASGFRVSGLASAARWLVSSPVSRRPAP